MALLSVSESIEPEHRFTCGYTIASVDLCIAAPHTWRFHTGATITQLIRVTPPLPTAHAPIKPRLLGQIDNSTVLSVTEGSPYPHNMCITCV